jgi:predicted Zn-dependent protease
MTAAARWPRRWAALLLLASLLGACDDPFAPPSPDRAAIAAAQREIAASAAPRPISRSPAADRAMLQQVAARLQQAAQPLCRAEQGKLCSFTLELVQSPEPNAFASGRNHIAVTTGMMRLLETEDELAAVVAHEMAHHIADHIAEGGWRSQLGALVGALVGTAADLAVEKATGIDPGLSGLGPQAGAQTARLTYSKRDEREADYLAVWMLVRAGFDADRAGGLWAKLTALSGQQKTGLLDSHPAGPERLAAWRRAVAEIRADPQAMPARKR